MITLIPILALVSLIMITVPKFKNYSAVKMVLITAGISIGLYTIFLIILYFLITNNYIK